MKKIIWIIAALGLAHAALSYADAAETRQLLDVHYGPHERQIFDLWLPGKSKKAPLVIYIHGGGWSAGSKEEMRARTSLIERYNQNGIAVAAINYRFLKHAPLQTIMREDIGGFVQFMRAHADEYNLNKDLILPYGVSAGASASAWLATHDDIADPNSPDPVRRESTRVTAAGHINGQISYDYTVWYQFYGKEPTDRFMGDQVWTRYHFDRYDDIFTPEGERVRRDLDMYGNLTPDDAPMLFWCNLADDPLKDANHFIHSPRHGRLLHQKAVSLGLQSQALIRADGATMTNDPHTPVFDFFLKVLSQHQKRFRKDRSHEGHKLRF